MPRVLDAIKATPPYRFARSAKDRLERLAFGRGDLADTGTEVELEEFGLDDPERVGYVASHWGFLRRALRRCEVGPTDVFLDIGSGKGRIVWQAARHPFRRVIGVEISPELNEVARGNIERNRDRLVCDEIEFATADAASYRIPDDVTFIYLYNPFKGELFRRVLGNITESLDRNPRDLTLIYANPELDDDVTATGRFERIHVLKGLRPDSDLHSWVNLYASRPKEDATDGEPRSAGTGGRTETEIHQAIEPLEEEWDELARGASPFLQPGWIAAWWNAFGKGELVILSVRRDGRVVGVLPLARSRGALHSTTNWHSPLYGAVTEDRAAGRALAEALLEQRARRVHLNFLAGDAQFLEDFRAAADASGHRVAERVVLRSPYVELTGDWDNYWRSRSRNMRKGLRRRRNRLEELGEVSVEIAAGEEALGRLDEAFALEASGWKGREGTAITSRPETKRFYEEVARWAAERGTLRIATLRLDGRALAMHFSIEAGDDYLTLKVGYEAEFEKLAPGKLLDREMIEYAFSSKLSSFELLGDADPYKLDWADELHERIELQAFARSPLGLLEGLAQTHGRALARRAIAIRQR